MLRNVLRISFSGRETTWSPGELELVPNSIICYCSFGLCIYCLYFCIRDIVQQCTLYKVGRAVGEEEQGGGGLRQVGDAEVAAEAQKPSWHRGIAIRKVFARPESFCA